MSSSVPPRAQEVRTLNFDIDFDDTEHLKTMRGEVSALLEMQDVSFGDPTQYPRIKAQMLSVISLLDESIRPPSEEKKADLLARMSNLRLKTHELETTILQPVIPLAAAAARRTKPAKNETWAFAFQLEKTTGAATAGGGGDK